jgi:drug/metabolite transporter (DMT)-like permease
MFDELPDLWTVIGAMIIVLAGLYVFHRESQLRAVGSNSKVR